MHVFKAVMNSAFSVLIHHCISKCRKCLEFCIILTLTGVFFSSAAADASNFLSIEEKNWLEENPDKLVLWFNTDFPPIEFVSDSGEFTGMGADIIALLEQQLGVVFRKQASSDWNAHLAALADGKCAIAPTIVATAGREGYAYFTEPYASSPVVIITADNFREDQTLSDLNGKRVAVVSGYATEGYLREYADLQVEVVAMPDVVHALRATAFGQVDAYVENLVVAAYYIHKEGIPNLRVAGDTPYSFSWSIGISRRYPLLASAVKKAVVEIPAEDLKAARERWVLLKIDTGWSSETVRLLGIVFVFVVLLALGLLIISYVLRRRLREKVAGLETAHMQICHGSNYCCHHAYGRRCDSRCQPRL